MSSGGQTAARCTNAFLCWPGNPLEFNTSPGRASETETTSGRGSVGRASPCQGEGREFESRRPLDVGDLPEPSYALLVEWPRGEATACKAVYTGSNPVSTSKRD